jgi:hypothetical protein
MIENWRRHHNTVRQLGSLGYKPAGSVRLRGPRVELEIAQAAGQLMSVQNCLSAAPTLSIFRRYRPSGDRTRSVS